ncbi:MAG: hypothetical protein RIA65_13520 [Woeseia sp.]
MNKFVAILGSAVLLAGTAFADDMDKEKTFSELDQNQDGVLTQAEASIDQELMAKFDAADTDQDGMLNSMEYDNAKNETEDAE